MRELELKRLVGLEIIDTVRAVRVSFEDAPYKEGWIIEFSIKLNDTGLFCLETARGETRVFKTLDSVESVLSTLRIKSFQVFTMQGGRHA